MHRSALVAFLAAACTASPPADHAPDAGGSGTADAAPAAAIDGAIDAAPIHDPPVGVAHALAWTDQGGIDFEAWFVVHDRDGLVWSVSAPVPEPGSYFTQLDIPAGAMVTILRRDGFGHPRRTTFVGVEPGDHLVPPYAPLSQREEGVATVRVPRFSADVRHYQVELAGGCINDLWIPDAETPAEVIEIRVHVVTACVDTSHGDQLLVVSAFDAAGRRVGTLSRYDDLPWVIDLSASSWSTPTAAPVAVTAAPRGPEWERTLCLRGWSPGPALRNPLLESCAKVPLGAGDFATTAPVPPGTPIVWQQVARIRDWNRTLYQDLRVSPDPGAALDLSWTARPAPAIAIDSQGARPEIRTTGDLGGYLGAVTWIDDGGAGSWQIVHPPAASLRVPALPDVLSVYRLADGEHFTEMQLFLPGRFTTYAAFRTAILPPIAQQPVEERSLTVPSVRF